MRALRRGLLAAAVVGAAACTADSAPDFAADSTPDATGVVTVETPPAPEVRDRRPVAAVRILDAPGIEYDVSPDGRWIASSGTEGLCLTAVGPSADPVCDPSRPSTVTRVRWSPDSAHVVSIPDVFRTLEAGPIEVLGTDGSTAVLFESPVISSEPTVVAAAPFAASFIDASTVVFARVLDDPFRTEFSTVELDGRTPRRVGVLEAPDDRSVWLPASDWVVGDRALYMTMVGDTALPDGIWRFDLVDGSSAKIVGEEVGDPPPSRAGREPVDVGGEALLVAHAARLGRFTRSVDERDFFDIVDLGTGLVTPIRDRETDRVNRQAALSPDGSFVAVMAEYLGDDDRVRESAFQRISVASVASVVGGSPQWYDLATFDSKAASLDLGVGLTSLVWDLDDRLFAEMSDGLYRIELAEVG